MSWTSAGRTATLAAIDKDPIQTFELPGDAVFPESVGVDPATGDAYTGSMTDGTLYRLAAGGAEVWSPASADGRSQVAGVKIDERGRLWAAGGYKGTLHVYDLATGSPLAHLDTRRRPSCVNDIAFGPGGTAYITDSFVSVLFRVRGEPLAIEPWIDLAERGVPWPDGLNFNGIILTPDGKHLVSCQTNLGRFWRISLSSGQVDEVKLEGGPLEHADGLALAGSTLYAAINARNLIAIIDLAPDGSSGTVKTTLTSDSFAFPTAVAVQGKRLLVLNSQLDKMGGTPRLPFTVVAIDPAAT